MTLPRLASIVRLEPVLPKLRLRELPAGALALLDKLTPLLGGQRGSGSGRFLKLDLVRQGPGRLPFAQNHFAQGKGLDQIEFVRRRVE